jgi:hypothetical protein
LALSAIAGAAVVAALLGAVLAGNAGEKEQLPLEPAPPAVSFVDSDLDGWLD